MLNCTKVNKDNLTQSDEDLTNMKNNLKLTGVCKILCVNGK